MKIDYNFCMKAKLTVRDLLVWLDLDQLFEDDYSWDFFGRNAMVFSDGRIRISCLKKDFDRWANSEEMWFDTSRKPEKRAFIEWIKEQRANDSEIECKSA